MVVVIRANLGGEREPGWDRQGDVGHFRKVCTFAAEQFLHISPAFRLAGAEEIDVLAHKNLFLKTCSPQPDSGPGALVEMYGLGREVSKGRKAGESDRWVPCFRDYSR